MAVDAFMKFGDIEGESQGRISLKSFSWGASNSGLSVCGGGSGRVLVQDFSFTSKPGLQSVPLFHAVTTGRHIKEATLTVEHPLMVVKMSDVLISSYKIDLPFQKSEGEVPVEFVSFNFAKIEVTGSGGTASFDICHQGGS